MDIKVLIEKLNLKTFNNYENREIKGVCISDMISDVMANAKSGDLWLTIQTHKNIVPAANLVDISAIIITGAKEVPQDTLSLANKHNIPILSSEYSTYELAGRLYDMHVGID